MTDCKHVFVGRADGVHCTRCGLHLTAQQYHELLHPPEVGQGMDAGKITTGEMSFDGACVVDMKTGEKVKPAKSAAEAPQDKPKKKTTKKKVIDNG